MAGLESPRGRLARKSCRSLPAVNAPRTPWITTARTAVSASASRSASARCWYIAVVMAFFFSGRFMPTRSVVPSRSTVTCVMAPSFTIVASRRRGVAAGDGARPRPGPAGGVGARPGRARNSAAQEPADEPGDRLGLLQGGRVPCLFHDPDPRSADPRRKLLGVHHRDEPVVLSPDQQCRGLDPVGALPEALVRNGPEE